MYQYCVSFRWTTQWFDIYIPYEMISTINLVTIYPHTKLLQYYWWYSLCCIFHPSGLFTLGCLYQLYPSLWKLERNQDVLSRWKNQWTVMYTDSEMVSNHEKSWRKTQCLLLSERINLRRLHKVSPTTRHFCKRQNYRRVK